MNELKNAEVETALETLFSRVDELASKVDTTSSTASAALSIAKEVQNSVTNIHVAPTNGYDVALKIAGKAAGVLIIGIIGYVIVRKAKIHSDGYKEYLTKFADGNPSKKPLQEFTLSEENE